MAMSFPKRSATWFTLFLVGISAALAGWVAALLAFTFVSIVGIVGVWPYFVELYVVEYSLPAALSSLLIGPLFWWLFIIQPRQLTLRRGILVGSLGSLVAHPLFWFLAMVIASLRGTKIVSVLGIKHLDLIGELLESLFLSMWSLLFVGWITALVGGVVGAVLALVVAHIERKG
jgi:hypothetical protein